jgi:colanic acid biosynthesis glycosyl transferase WcaI
VSPTLLSTTAVVAKARLRKVPVGVVVQDIYGKGVVETGAMGGTLGNVATRFEARVLRAASGVAVIHDRFRTALGEVGVDEAASTVIRNWTHLDAADDPTPHESIEIRREYGWGDDEIIVVHAGNMGVKQGLENVVAAAKLAASEVPAGTIRFVMVGDGNQRRSLEDAGAGIPTLQFIKVLPDNAFRSVLQTADVLLVNERPGVKDMAVPSKLTTYFRTGKPVVAATDQSSAAAGEVRAAEAGAIVAPADPRALLDAVLSIGRDKAAGLQYGESGKRYSQEVLSREGAIRSYENWCHDLSSARSRVVHG